jgi:proline racemase
MPKLKGKTMSERMLYMKTHYDWFRQALMYEPRGHEVMSGAILQDPCDPRADVGVIYIETGGYLPMCGHDTIGFCTALVEAGLIEYEEPHTTITLDTPAGLVKTDLEIKNGRVQNVAFENVPSFFYKTVTVDVSGLGSVNVDIAYGGNFYGIVSADSIGLKIDRDNVSEIIEKAIKIRRAVNRTTEVVHPVNRFIKGLTHIEFSTRPSHPQATIKNTVVVPPGGIDRSPCGTGTSAKMATLYSKGELAIGEWFIHESIVGSLFKGKIVKETTVGDYRAVVNIISGSAWVTGFHQFYLNRHDPQRSGFLLIPEMEDY